MAKSFACLSSEFHYLRICLQSFSHASIVSPEIRYFNFQIVYLVSLLDENAFRAVLKCEFLWSLLICFHYLVNCLHTNTRAYVYCVLFILSYLQLAVSITDSEDAIKSVIHIIRPEAAEMRFLIYVRLPFEWSQAQWRYKRNCKPLT
jgi:hypothetical protein